MAVLDSRPGKHEYVINIDMSRIKVVAKGVDIKEGMFDNSKTRDYNVTLYKFSDVKKINGARHGNCLVEPAGVWKFYKGIKGLSVHVQVSKNHTVAQEVIEGSFFCQGCDLRTERIYTV